MRTQPVPSSTTAPHILVGLTQLLLRTGISVGLDRAHLLAAANLSEEDLADRDAYIDLDRHLRLAHELIRQRPGVNLALAALPSITPAAMGILGYVITNATDLRGALNDFIRYQRLMTDTAEWRLTIEDHASIEVRMHPRLSELGHPIEAAVGAWVILGRALTDVAWTPLSLRFRHHPLGDPHEHERLFGVPVQFGAQDNTLCLAQSALALPIRAARPQLRLPMLQHAQARLSEINAVDTVSAKLSDVLTNLVPDANATQEKAARRLGLSIRTLSRRLHDEGTTFGAVLDAVRRQLAQTWLQDRSVAIHEVAFLLGYTEPSTFYRAFKRWTGTTPQQWRSLA